MRFLFRAGTESKILAFQAFCISLNNVGDIRKNVTHKSNISTAFVD